MMQSDGRKYSLVGTKNVLLQSNTGLPQQSRPRSILTTSQSVDVFPRNVVHSRTPLDHSRNVLLEKLEYVSTKYLSLQNSLLTASSVKSSAQFQQPTFSLQSPLLSSKRKLSETCIVLEKKRKDEDAVIAQPAVLHVAMTLEKEAMPRYELQKMVFEGPERVRFTAVTDDLEFQMRQSKERREAMKMAFLTTVSTSLINKPKFLNPEDETRKCLIEQAKEIFKFDPEFVLKVALYARQELNIRSTANFLLSCASLHEICRPYLKKYFKDSIRLPSDWIEVAEIYKTFPDSDLKVGSLPAVLRKVMKEKFSDFDDYQLAKYNKTPSKKKAKGKKTETTDTEMEQVVLDDMETAEELLQRAFTLKRLIRLLHINRPAIAVMSLLGKRYPADTEEFRRNRLPGAWDSERAGKRMKLPVPETWETQLSLHGNKKEVWEKLIDNNKLPYMATLRNLRNLLLAQISTKHHHKVQATISKETAVVKSRQFPLSFYSAYKAVVDLEGLLEKLENVDPSKFKKKIRDPEKAWAERRRKKTLKKADGLDSDLFTRYKNALEKAMQISVQNNLDPIPGRTLVISDVLSCKPQIKKKDDTLCMGNLLLAMMCLHACEECELQAVSDAEPWRTLSLDGATLLENARSVAESLQLKEQALPSLRQLMTFYYEKHFQSQLNGYLSSSVAHSKMLNNIVLLTNGKEFAATDGPQVLKRFLQKYRAFVNPKLLFIQVDVSGAKRNEEINSPLDVYLAGYSDQLLRFMSERGSGAQLNCVETIDKKYNLKPLPKPLLKVTADDNQYAAICPNVFSLPEWRTVRVFISSTFKDMHGERDLLVRYVFPELRARARSLRINIHEVDLRWGITEAEAFNQGSLELCLTEVARCQLFVGILGARYGWIPLPNQIPSDSSFDWVRDYPHRASVTELEMYSAGLSDPQANSDRAFFFIRDSKFEKDIPSEWSEDFRSENSFCHQRIESLKDRFRKSGLEVYDGYSCKWGGVVGGCPIVSGLEEFGQRVLDNLWNAIVKTYSPQVGNDQDEITDIDFDAGYGPHLNKAHQFKELIGREQVVSECLKNLADGLLLVTGKLGCGKTALLGHLFNKLPAENTFVYFVGLANNEANLSNFSTLICQEICRRFCIQLLLPENKTNMASNTLWEILRKAVEATPYGHIILLIDGIENLKETGASTFDWLPCTIPEGVRLVFTATENSPSYQALLKRSQQGIPLSVVNLAPLQLDKRKELVSSALEPHRKTLSSDPFNNQMLLLVTKKDAGFPVYLQMACEELKMFGVFEELTNKIRSLPPTIPYLLKEVVNQMEITHGKAFTEITLCLLAIVREGLKEYELERILNVYFTLPSLDLSLEDAFKAFHSVENSIVPIELASFFRTLRCFLCPTVGSSYEDTIHLNHPAIYKIVSTLYNMTQTGKAAKFHKFIAAYFISTAKDTADGTWLHDSPPRAYRAIIYHLLLANCLQDATTIFCSLAFLSAVGAVGVTGSVLDDVRSAPIQNELSNDCSNFLNIYSVSQKSSPIENSFADYVRFLSRNLNILNRLPFYIYQQAINEPIGSAVAQDAHNMKYLNQCFQWLTKSNASYPCYLNLSDFSEEILCTAGSSDGRYVAHGGQDALVHVLNSDTGKLVRTCTGHAQSISSLCFVGAHKLCSGSNDGTMSLWDVANGFRVAVLKGHKKRISGCCSDSPGDTLVSVSWDHAIRIWSGRDGREITCITKNKCPLTSVAFHPSKQIVVTGGWDKTVKMWDLEKMNRKAVFRGHVTSVQSVTFSPNGLYVASGDLYGKIFIWSSTSGAALSRFGGHLRAISCLSFLPSGNAIVSGSHDGTLKIWGNHWKTFVSKWKLLAKVTVVRFLTLHHLAVGSEDGSVTVYDIKNGSELWNDITSVDSVSCLAKSDYFSDEEGPSVLIGSQSGSLRIVANQKSKYLGNMKNSITAGECMGNIVVAGHISGQVAVFNSTLRQHKCCLDYVDGHQGKVTCCSITSKETFVTTGTDKCIRIWKLEQQTILPDGIISNAHGDWITSVACDNGLLVTGSQDCSIKFWNLDTRVDEFQTGIDGPVVFLTIEGDYVFGGGANGSVGVWMRNGKAVSFQDAPREVQMSVIAFYFKIGKETTEKKDAVYSGYLANVDENGELVVRKPFSHSQMMTLEGHSGPVTSCTTLKNGNVLSSSADGSLRFWSVAASDATITNQRHREPIVAVGMSQNGRVAFSSDHFESTIIWTVGDADLLYVSSIEVKEDFGVTAATFVQSEGKTIIRGERRHGKFPYNMLNAYKSKQIGQSVNYLSSTRVTVDAEVTDVYWCHNNNSVLASLKSGQIVLTDPKLTKTATVKGGNNWSMAARMLSPLCVVVAVNRTVKEFQLPKSSWPSVITSEPTSTYKATLNESTIVKVLEVNQDVIYTGDTAGLLTIKTQSGQQSLRAHKDGIVGICFSDKFVFTGSKDGMVKVWDKEEFKQIGLFTFAATVTCLSVRESETKNPNYAIVLVGTTTGELHLLRWSG